MILREQLDAHRELISACKLLLQRFERNCEVHGYKLDDWKFITRAFRAIEQSKDTLTMGTLYGKRR